ncbi:MAG: hypothetical protein U0792_22265 [Gemmataceae bacterium]
MSKFIAIDLDAQGLFVVSGTARGGNVRIEQALAWAGTEAEGGPPPLTLDTARRIGEQLRDRLRAAGIAPAPVVVGVPRERVVLKELRYPAVPLPEEPNIVRFQALKELSDAPEDVVLDYVPLAGDTPGEERRSMAVAIRKDLFRAIQQICEAANLRLASVTPRPYAIAAGVGRAIVAGIVDAPESKADAVAALATGPGGGEFTVIRNGEVVFTRAIAGPVLASETMLLAEVRRNLTMYAGSNPSHPLQALYIPEADNRWTRRLRPALGIHVHAYDPLAGAVPELEAEVRGRFAGSAGLLAGRAIGDPPINFAEPRQPNARGQPRQEVDARRRPGGGRAALGWRHSWLPRLGLLQTKRWHWRPGDVTMEAAVATLEVEGKRLAAVEGWKARRVVWLDELYDMADRFPVAGGFHATSFTGKALPPDPKTGKQDNQAAVEVKVTAKNPAPVNEFVDKILADAVDPAPKNPGDPGDHRGSTLVPTRQSAARRRATPVLATSPCSPG